MEILILLLISAAVCGVIGYGLGDLNGKGNGPLGGILGALLGPIGVICALLLPKAEEDAPSAKAIADPNAKDIARLELELARLKAGKPVKAIQADDDEIPTYKLD